MGEKGKAANPGFAWTIVFLLTVAAASALLVVPAVTAAGEPAYCSALPGATWDGTTSTCTFAGTTVVSSAMEITSGTTLVLSGSSSATGVVPKIAYFTQLNITSSGSLTIDAGATVDIADTFSCGFVSQCAGIYSSGGAIVNQGTVNFQGTDTCDAGVFLGFAQCFGMITSGSLVNAGTLDLQTAFSCNIGSYCLAIGANTTLNQGEITMGGTYGCAYSVCNGIDVNGFSGTITNEGTMTVGGTYECQSDSSCFAVGVSGTAVNPPPVLTNLGTITIDTGYACFVNTNCFGISLHQADFVNSGTLTIDVGFTCNSYSICLGLSNQLASATNEGTLIVGGTYDCQDAGAPAGAYYTFCEGISGFNSLPGDSTFDNYGTLTIGGTYTTSGGACDGVVIFCYGTESTGSLSPEGETFTNENCGTVTPVTAPEFNGPIGTKGTCVPGISASPAGPETYSVGQSATVLIATVTALGATLPFPGPGTTSVEWYSSPTSTCSSASTDTHVSGDSFTPATGAVGTTYYCAVVSDSNDPAYHSPSNAVEVSVKVASTTGVSCTPNPVGVNLQSSCTATVSGDSPTGTVSFSSSDTSEANPVTPQCTLLGGTCSVQVAGLELGSPNVDAAYSGDPSNLPSSGSTTLTVTLTSTTTRFNCSPNPVAVGSQTTCTATVTGNVPSGTVTWSTTGAGSFLSNTCALSSGSCAAVFTPTAVSASVSITGSYGGDSANTPSIYTGAVAVTRATSVVSVSCSPQTLRTGSPTTCTATVTGFSPTGLVSFMSSTGAGTFTPPNGQCTLSSGSCSVVYQDAVAGLPTVTAGYAGDTSNTPGSGTYALTVEVPPPPPTGSEICQHQASAQCFTSFIAFDVTVGGVSVDANVTFSRTNGPNQAGTTETGSPLQMAWYDVSILDTVSYTVTLPNGHTVTGTVSNADPWTLKVVQISG